MDEPLQVTCEICDEKADVVHNVHVDASGTRLEWPKASVKSDGIYFTLNCPTCGEREQCLSRHGDTE